MDRKLPMRSTFIVCPFSEGAGGELRPGQTRNLTDRREALRIARSRSRDRAGVMVIEQETDLAGEVWSEPRLVTRHGRIPEAVVRQLAS